jgi:hypothetical protein
MIINDSFRDVGTELKLTLAKSPFPIMRGNTPNMFCNETSACAESYMIVSSPSCRLYEMKSLYVCHIYPPPRVLWTHYLVQEKWHHRPMEWTEDYTPKLSPLQELLPPPIYAKPRSIVWGLRGGYSCVSGTHARVFWSDLRVGQEVGYVMFQQKRAANQLWLWRAWWMDGRDRLCWWS